MKRKWLFFLLILLLSSGFGFKLSVYAIPEDENLEVLTKADAQEATEPGSEKRPAKVKEAPGEEKKEKKATRSATVRERFSEKRKKRILSFWHRMLRRLKAALSRLEKLVTRIESRIEKFKAKDADTSQAEARLVEAKEAIGVTTDNLSAAETQFELIFTAEDPKEMFKEVKSLVHEVKESLKEAHQALVQAIVALKGLKPTLTPEE